MTSQSITVGEGSDRRSIEVLSTPPAAPGGLNLFWLSGFMSDMASTKATALAEWAEAQGFGVTRFDYSGHGLSGGDFLDGTIGRWLEEASAVFAQRPPGPCVVVGSSMGGYIALLLARRLRPGQVRGLVLIAPAWDMTEQLMWAQFSPDDRRTLIATGVYHRPSEYGTPYPITRALIEEGRMHSLLAAPFDPGCPIEVLQGLQDQDVPAAHTRRLQEFLPAERLRFTEIADGEHRLSRPQDLALLYEAIARAAGLDQKA